MTRILVVDDSSVDRVLVETLLAQPGECTVECVASGADALDSVDRRMPDVVVTDLVMPGMDGLEVVAELRARHPALPVVLMTSRGSEEIAVQALQAGAASYVPKRALEEHLRPTIEDILEFSRERRAERALRTMIQRSEFEYSLPSDVQLVRPLVRHLQSAILRMGLCTLTEGTQVGIALHEAVQNAAEHGNLELDSELRERDLAGYRKLMVERSRSGPFRDRRVHVEAALDREQARFTVRDEGRGFDPATLPDARAPANLDRLGGRGVLLMRTFMDEVTYNPRGNEVTLVKRRA